MSAEHPALTGKVERLLTSSLLDKRATDRRSIHCTLLGIDEDRCQSLGKVPTVKEKTSFLITKPEIVSANLPGADEMVLNTRMWSGVSVEEMIKLATAYGLPGTKAVALQIAELIGANIVVSGISEFTSIVPTSLLKFPDCRLMVITRTVPCVSAGQQLATAFPGIDPSTFPDLALGIRGLVGMVYKGGDINLQDEVLVQRRGIELRY